MKSGKKKIQTLNIDIRKGLSKLAGTPVPARSLKNEGKRGVIRS